MEPKPFSKKVNKNSQELRLLLRNLMLDENFAPNPKEYWHFSFGDETWAKYYNKKILFEEIKAPEKLKYTIQKQIFNKLNRTLLQTIYKLFGIETNY